MHPDPPDFPTCRHRGAELSLGVHRCDHPQVLMPPGVDRAACHACAKAGVFCDRAPVPPAKHVVRTDDPTKRSRPWNFFRSMADFIADGCRTLPRDAYRQRLVACTHCLERTDNTCAICGCYLALKARGRAFKCPRGRWPAPAEAADPPSDEAT